MAKKKKHDYSLFSKQELVNFLNQHDGKFKFIYSPFDLMLDARMNSIMSEIDELNKAQSDMNAKSETIEDKLLLLLEHQKNHKKWEKLNKEYDRLSKLRFGG